MIFVLLDLLPDDLWLPQDLSCTCFSLIFKNEVLGIGLPGFLHRAKVWGCLPVKNLKEIQEQHILLLPF